jgi:hypothetical protein
MSGQPFTIRKPLQETHLVYQTAVLSKAELDQPSCPACYRPGLVRGYCARCEESGAARRHRSHR